MVGQQVTDVLNGANDMIAQYNAVNDPDLSPFVTDDLNLDGMPFVITPTMHLGGDGYFFKFDFPITIHKNFWGIGLGLYPINYGKYIEAAKIMPYGGLGGVIGYMGSGTFTPKSGGADVAVAAGGPLINPLRLALGLKAFPIKGLAVGLDLGLSPFALGFVIDPVKVTEVGAGLVGGQPLSPGTALRGGTGMILDGAISVEWQ
jgi:hypothetical protein